VEGLALATMKNKKSATTTTGPVTELPAYPTPYEMWKKKHEVVEEPRAPVVLGEPEWDDLVERYWGLGITVRAIWTHCGLLFLD
jgi:hypothetical protein